MMLLTNTLPTIQVTKEETDHTVVHHAQAKELTEQERNYQLFDQLSGNKLLKRIGECESGFRMVANKSGSSAYGIFQIMKVHDARAERLGVSRLTPEGNIKIAISLFEEQGTTPWNASKHCWGS